MNPTPGDVYVSRPLTQLSISYTLQQNEFIADRVFGNIPVDQQGGTFRKYVRAEWNRTDVEKRAPRTETKGIGYTLTDDNYHAHVYGIHEDVDDQTRGNAQEPVNLDRDATFQVTRQLLLKRDLIWFDTFMKPSAWDTVRTGTTDFVKWSAANSTPIKDLHRRINQFRRRTGIGPNKLILGADTWVVLQDHADLLDRIKAQQGPQIPTRQLLAQVLEIDEVLIGYQIVNGAVEGADPDEVNDFIMDADGALLLYTNPTPSQLTVSAGYTFSWTGYLNAGNMGNRIKRFRMEEIASDRIEGEMAFDMKVVASDLGEYFDDAVDV